LTKIALKVAYLAFSDKNITQIHLAIHKAFKNDSIQASEATNIKNINKNLKTNI
jgi:hypothetical protein